MDTQNTGGKIETAPTTLAGAAGGAEVTGVSLTPEAKAEFDAALLAEQEAKAKAEAEAMEAKRLEDEAAHKAEADRVAAEKAQAAEDAANAPPLSLNGPTLEEFVADGNDPAFYPPEGYAVVTAKSRAEADPLHPDSRVYFLEQRVADLERKFKALHLG